MTPRPRRGQQCPKSPRPGAHEVGGRGGPRSVWMEWWAGQERHWGRGGGGWGGAAAGNSEGSVLAVAVFCVMRETDVCSASRVTEELAGAAAVTRSRRRASFCQNTIFPSRGRSRTSLSCTDSWPKGRSTPRRRWEAPWLQAPQRAWPVSLDGLRQSLFSPPAQKGQRPPAKRKPSLPEPLCVGPRPVGPT